MPITNGGPRAAYKVDRYSGSEERSTRNERPLKKDPAIKGRKRPALPPPEDAPKIAKQTQARIQKYEQLAETVKKVGSTFGVKRKDIVDAIERGDLDGSIMAFQRQAYATIMGLIPIAEGEYRKWKRESQAYALNAMVNLGRELAGDLAQSSDRARLAEVLTMEIIEPMFRALLQHIAQQSVTTKAYLAGKLKPNYEANAISHLDDSLKETAAYLQDQYQVVAQNITRQITGQE